MAWHDIDVLNFPVGTVIAKTFAYPDPKDDPTPDERYLETRIEFLDDTGWYGYSYVWNEAQTDAELRLGGGALPVSWPDRNGQNHDTIYEVPNANQCLSCHLARSLVHHQSNRLIREWIQSMPDSSPQK